MIRKASQYLARPFLATGAEAAVIVFMDGNNAFGIFDDNRIFNQSVVALSTAATARFCNLNLLHVPSAYLDLSQGWCALNLNDVMHISRRLQMAAPR
jgi:hypothetical protein